MSIKYTHHGYHQLRVREADIPKTAFAIWEFRVHSDAIWLDKYSSGIHESHA